MAEATAERKESIPFLKLFAFADPTDVTLMTVGILAAAGYGLSMPLMSVFFGNLVDSFAGTLDINDIVDRVSKVSLKFVFLAVWAGVLSFLHEACWSITGERQAARIRLLYLKMIIRQDIAFFDKEANTGEVAGRMSGDTVLIQDAMGPKVGMFIQQISTFIGAFAVGFIKGWLLTLVMLSAVPLIVLASVFMATIRTKMAARGQTGYAEAGRIVEQTIGSIRTVASFTGEKQAIEKYEKSLKRAYKSGLREGLAAGLGFGSAKFCSFCSYALAIWYGAKLIINKGYSGGDVISIILSVLFGSMSLGQASPNLNAFAAGQAAAFKMFETIKRRPEIDAYNPCGRIIEDIQGDIELRDVHFSYPTRPNEKIFNGFSFAIPSGTIAALVGQSGSGKSTVVSLIERFYDPQAGEVLIDGINVKEFQLKWIRQKIGIVSQEPMLFSCSIKDNIMYGKEGASIEEIRAALELANAAKFIDKLPKGLDTMVGEHGTQLSGGQKQRIAIARAILKNPRILLLDEATSALDAESERVVQEALNKIMVNRTTVIVAHRLTTVQNADIIAVIQKGTIVERGSPLELLNIPNGAYCQLISLQEMKKGSNRTETDLNAVETSAVAGRQLSVQKSLSHGSSIGVGNSSRHSFSVSFGIPNGLDIHVSTRRELDVPLPPQQSKEIPLCRLASLNKPEIPLLLVGTIAAGINGSIFPVFGILFSSVIHTFYEPPSELQKDSRFWALMFIVIGTTALVASPVQSYLFAVAGCRLTKRIQSMAFKKVVYTEVGWFDNSENSSGAVGARISMEAAILRSLVGDALALIIQNMTSAVAGLIIAFLACWQLALIVLAMLPLLGISGWIQMKFMDGLGAESKKMCEEASQVANDAVVNIRTVASFCAEEKVMEMYAEKCEGPMKKGIKQGLISGISLGLSNFFLYCILATTFYFGAHLVANGKTSFTKVFRVFFALTMSINSFILSSSIVLNASKAKSSAASIFAIIDRKSEIDASDETGITIEDLRGDIEFQDVSFKYPTRPETRIFRDICLAIQSGKTVALVGENGSGKSTVISLLQRFYNPDSGKIWLDGIEIQMLQLRWLRQQMGLVGQEPILFNDTIRANIVYGRDGDATEAEIIAAAESANAHKFISHLQQGYDTTVGERGIQLSGGQKQRLAIARAIMKEPKILLLDEATSALDAESERMVQETLDQLTVHRTTIIVAHRLSTIQGADLIAVVKNGVIIEKGNHEALINNKAGVYASLVALHRSGPSS